MPADSLYLKILRFSSEALFLPQENNNGNNNYLKYYDESHCCAYLAAVLNFVPIDNLRLYLLYAQNELIVPNEPPYKPNSFGIQSGFEYAIPHFNEIIKYPNTRSIICQTGSTESHISPSLAFVKTSFTHLLKTFFSPIINSLLRQGEKV